jgi:hypothetical protein
LREANLLLLDDATAFSIMLVDGLSMAEEPREGGKDQEWAADDV